MAEIFKLEKPVYDWLLVIGPGGIRTHDQGIMSPLRYRCATGPSFNVAWYNLFYCHLAKTFANFCATYLSSEDYQSSSSAECQQAQVF